LRRIVLCDRKPVEYDLEGSGLQAHSFFAGWTGVVLMKKIEQVISALAESVAHSMGMEILEVRCVKLHRKDEVRIVLDKTENPVSISDCTEFSRNLSRLMDVEDPIAGPYSIEVSSPGFRRLIRIPGDLSRFQNHRVKVRLNEPLGGRTVWLGILRNDTDPLMICTEEAGAIDIPFRSIRQLNLHE
jgi:ribosome maturation factor RimP